MPPTLLILGIGPERRVRVPLPVFVLWPLLLLGWLLAGLAWPFVRGRGRAAVARMLMALRCCHLLRGLRIDVRGKRDGVYLNVI